MYVFLMLLDTPRERDLFTEIYEKYQHFLIYLAQGIVKDRSLAEDAAHDAFLTMTRYMDRVQDPNAPATRNFLATLVRCRAIDLLRKENKYYGSEDTEEMMAELPSKEQDPLDRLVAQAEYDELRQCLAELSEEHRTALELKYVHELKEREIAEVLGVSEKTAGMRVYRGRLKLRELLTARREKEK